MTNKMRSMIKIGFGLFIPFLLIFAGCGPSQQEMMARDHLANAKAAYAHAKANPNVEINAQIPLMDAGRAVEAASQAKEFDEMDHLAYLAERKTQIAVATAEEQMAENDKKALSRETEQLIVQGREREQRAKMEARDVKRAGQGVKRGGQEVKCGGQRVERGSRGPNTGGSSSEYGGQRVKCGGQRVERGGLVPNTEG